MDTAKASSSQNLGEEENTKSDEVALSRPLKWMDDKETDVCLDCQSKFRYFLGKHHCRCCGQIFCKKCLVWMFIPKYIECPKPKVETWISSDLSYVCKKKCETYIKSQIEISKIRELMLSEPPTIADLIQKYREQPKVIDYYFGLLSEIQHCYPNHKFHEYQKKMLKSNWCDLSGHANYVCQIIKSVSWRDTTVRDRVSSIVLNMLISRPKDCAHVRCISQCATRSDPLLTTDEVIGVLASGVASSLPESILVYLLNILKLDPLLHAYLPFLVKLVYSWDQSELLLEKLSNLFKETNLIIQAYWLLRAAQEGAGDDLLMIRDIQKFINKWDLDKIKMIESDRIFFRSVVNATSGSDVERVLAMQSWPVSLPYSPTTKIVGYESAKEMDSGSKPTKVVFLVQKEGDESTTKISILFKKSKVIQDLVAINVMTLWLAAMKEACPTVQTVLYPVMPIGPDSGMCQFVENCCTISDIIKKGVDLPQWFNSKMMSLNLPPQTILSNYTNTLVMLTLAAHFLYIGDRHYENILLTHTGEIFHIDFDYMLGNKPMISAASSGIRLSSFMLKPVKHVENYMYDKFLEMIGPCTVKLHERVNSTFALLSVIEDEKKLEPFISERFFIRSLPEDIHRQIKKIVENSVSDHDVWLSGDTMHRLIKEKTIQKGVSAMATSVGSIMTGAIDWWRGAKPPS